MTARLTAGRLKVLYSQMVNEIIPTTMRTCIIAHSEKGKTVKALGVGPSYLIDI